MINLSTNLNMICDSIVETGRAVTWIIDSEPNLTLRNYKDHLSCLDDLSNIFYVKPRHIGIVLENIFNELVF